MHREIDAPVEKRLLDLFCEEALAADLGKQPRLDAVARRADRYDLDPVFRGKLGMRLAQPIAHKPGLEERHRAAACADANGPGRHRRSCKSLPCFSSPNRAGAKPAASDRLRSAQLSRLCSCGATAALG